MVRVVPSTDTSSLTHVNVSFIDCGDSCPLTGIPTASNVTRAMMCPNCFRMVLLLRRASYAPVHRWSYSRVLSCTQGGTGGGHPQPPVRAPDLPRCELLLLLVLRFDLAAPRLHAFLQRQRQAQHALALRRTQPHE